MFFFLILIYTLLGWNGPGKKRTVPVPTVAHTQRIALVERRLNRILNETVDTAPDHSRALPPIPIKLLPVGKGKPTRCLAYVPGVQPRIEVNEEVVVRCEMFGNQANDALACLIGHELAHYYHNHGQKQGFFAPLTIKQLAPANTPRNLEAIADRSGIFMAYLAGYDAFSIAPRIYADLYDAFGVTNLEGYLPRPERLKMVADTTARVRELAHWCELSEFFYLQQDFQAADRALSYVLARYPAPIIKNNLGAVKLNHALSLMGKVVSNELLRFAFPIEYDADNRLLYNRRRGPESQMIVDSLLTDAQYLFESILEKHPRYEAARINLSIAQLLSNQANQARQTLMPLLNQPGVRSANGVLMMAITEATLHNPSTANRLFGEAKRLGAFKAAHNTTMWLESQKPGWLQYWQTWVSQRTSSASSHPSGVVRSQPIPPPNWEKQAIGYTLGYLDRQPIQYAQTEGSAAYDVYGYGNGNRSHYRMARSTVQDLTGLRLGSSRQVLARSFASPSREVAGARGTQFVGYYTARSGLWLEYRDNALVGWTAYQQTR